MDKIIILVFHVGLYTIWLVIFGVVKVASENLVLQSSRNTACSLLDLRNIILAGFHSPGQLILDSIHIDI